MDFCLLWSNWLRRLALAWGNDVEAEDLGYAALKYVNMARQSKIDQKINTERNWSLEINDDGF